MFDPAKCICVATLEIVHAWLLKLLVGSVLHCTNEVQSAISCIALCLCFSAKWQMQNSLSHSQRPSSPPGSSEDEGKPPSLDGASYDPPEDAFLMVTQQHWENKILWEVPYNPGPPITGSGTRPLVCVCVCVCVWVGGWGQPVLQNSKEIE